MTSLKLSHVENVSAFINIKVARAGWIAESAESAMSITSVISVIWGQMQQLLGAVQCSLDNIL